MPEIFVWIEHHPSISIVITTLFVPFIGIVWYFIRMYLFKEQAGAQGPMIKAGGSISAGGDIIAGNKIVHNVNAQSDKNIASNGRITKIEINNIAGFKGHNEFRFENYNIISGNNGTGKSLIFEFISSLEDIKHIIDRWVKKGKKEQLNSFFNIYYDKGDETKYQIHIDKDNKLSYRINGAEVPLLKSPIKILYLKRDYRDYSVQTLEPALNEPEKIASYFSITIEDLSNVISFIERKEKHFINDLSISGDKGSLEVKILKDGPVQNFKELSSGEQHRVILEIIFSLAEYYSSFGSTILIIEQSAVPSVDDHGINKLFSTVRDKKMRFQFFFALYSDIDKYNTEGYRKYYLYDETRKSQEFPKNVIPIATSFTMGIK